MHIMHSQRIVVVDLKKNRVSLGTLEEKLTECEVLQVTKGALALAKINKLESLYVSKR